MPTATTRAKSKSKAKSVPREAVTPRTLGKPLVYEVLGLVFIGLGITLLLATFLPGVIPNALLHTVQWLFGLYGAWGVAAACTLLGLFLLIRLSRVEVTLTTLGIVMIYLVIISLLQLGQLPIWDRETFTSSPGGLLGSAIAWSLHAVMGQLAWLPLVFIGLGGIAIMTDCPLWMVLTWPVRISYLLFVRPFVRAMRVRRERERALQVEELQQEELRKSNYRTFASDLGSGSSDTTAVVPPKVNGRKAAKVPECVPLVDPFTNLPGESAVMVTSETQKLEIPPLEKLEGHEAAPRVTGVPSKKNPEQLQFSDDAVAPVGNRHYDLPPVELLTLTPKPDKPKKDDTDEKIAVLEKTLSSFGIDAKVVAVERGPRVTRFELVPPPGIRINRITNLADNLALSLAALDVRVEAPVPGKGVVGIEVPNKEPVIVDLREIVDSDTFARSKSPITVALGRDITGHPRVADLSRMPHLLIAGATNSGKSVCINCLICSILMRATPQQVKFLMVDPKRVELSLFQSIPHLIAPVAYDAKHAAGLLRWAIREMEQRYEMFAEKGVRNIIGFNEQARMEVMEELPYILIIIDELADLMMQAAAEFEASICRLAQLARATGIHLVIATQRPSVNVITGTIKANVPSRISFAVASQVDSRTVLDMNGAERLVGQGDMLFLPVDASKPSRIQGAYVSEKDINRIVEFVRTQGKPNFTDEIMAIEEEALNPQDGSNGGVNFSDEPEDELMQRALDYIRATKYASTSMLQRKFRIGYTRAARLMDLFEERGYVGPGQGSKPREVIFAPSSSVIGHKNIEIEEELDELDE